MKVFSLFLVFLWLIISCGQKQEEKKEVVVVEEPQPATVEEKDEVQEAIEELYQEVMLIHDRSMEQMGEIRRLSRQLKDSIENTNANPMEQEEVINRYRNGLKDLNNADQDMLIWMRQFDAEGKNTKNKKEKLDYYIKEKDKIIKVDVQVNEAIKNARTLLQ